MGDRLRAGIPSRHVTSQLGQLSLAYLRGLFNRVPGSVAIKAGMSPLSVGSFLSFQCDPMWHVSSRSGVVG